MPPLRRAERKVQMRLKLRLLQLLLLPAEELLLKTAPQQRLPHFGSFCFLGYNDLERR